MALHPLTDEQLKLLDDFKTSGLTLIQFAASIGKSYSSMHYLIDKERRLKEQDCFLKCNHGFVSVPLEKEHITPESFDVISNDVIAFSINDLMFKMTAQNLKKFMEAIKQ